MKCILHIGTEKTGTTLLQDWLYSNLEELKKQRIYLSGILGKTNNRLFASYFQSKFDDWTQQNNIHSQKEKEKFFSGFLEKLSLEIETASSEHEVFIITSEQLHSRITESEDIRKIHFFLNHNFDAVNVLCYFRPQADMAVSLHSTHLKAASSNSIDQFIFTNVKPENYYYNFKAIADNWSGVFGKQNCIFRIYDRKRFLDGDIRKDFLQQLPIQVDWSKLSFEIESANESLSALAGIAFALINRHISYRDGASGGINSLNTRLKQAILGLKSLNYGNVYTGSKDKISQLFERSNAEFLSQYFEPNASFSSEHSDPKNDKLFSYEEVASLVEDLMNALLPFASSEPYPRLIDEDADCLRDIGIKIERLSTNDALLLMQLARRARPDGPFINRKVDEYKAKLNENS